MDYIAEGLDTLKNMAQDINEVHLYRYLFCAVDVTFNDHVVVLFLLVHYITGT